MTIGSWWQRTELSSAAREDRLPSLGVLSDGLNLIFHCETLNQESRPHSHFTPRKLLNRRKIQGGIQGSRPVQLASSCEEKFFPNSVEEITSLGANRPPA